MAQVGTLVESELERSIGTAELETFITMFAEEWKLPQQWLNKFGNVAEAADNVLMILGNSFVDTAFHDKLGVTGIGGIDKKDEMVVRPLFQVLWIPLPRYDIKPKVTPAHVSAPANDDYAEWRVRANRLDTNTDLLKTPGVASAYGFVLLVVSGPYTLWPTPVLKTEADVEYVVRQLQTSTRSDEIVAIACSLTCSARAFLL